MAQKRKRLRPYGSGSVYQEGKRWVGRSRHRVVGEDGKLRIAKRRYEILGDVATMTRKKAEETWMQKLVNGGASHSECAHDERQVEQQGGGAEMDFCKITFEEHTSKWRECFLSESTKYRFSSRAVRECILKKHLIPRFGNLTIGKINTLEIQRYVAEMQRQGAAPNTIDQHHQILSDVLRAAVKWYGLPSNPARGVEMPRIKTVREKWALTKEEADSLLEMLALKPRVMVTLALMTGLRRGELFALRWRHFDEAEASISVREAVYRGHFDEPKTANGIRVVPIGRPIVELIGDWKKKSRRTGPDDLVFGTRNGKPEHPANILRRYVFPGCDALGLRRATWLTFRRTFSTWAHHKGIPAKAVAELMGHSDVRTQFVYVQSVNAEKRRAADVLAGVIGQ